MCATRARKSSPVHSHHNLFAPLFEHLQFQLGTCPSASPLVLIRRGKSATAAGIAPEAEILPPCATFHQNMEIGNATLNYSIPDSAAVRAAAPKDYALSPSLLLSAESCKG